MLPASCACMYGKLFFKCFCRVSSSTTGYVVCLSDHKVALHPCCILLRWPVRMTSPAVICLEPQCLLYNMCLILLSWDLLALPKAPAQCRPAQQKTGNDWTQVESIHPFGRSWMEDGIHDILCRLEMQNRLYSHYKQHKRSFLWLQECNQPPSSLKLHLLYLLVKSQIGNVAA